METAFDEIAQFATTADRDTRRSLIASLRKLANSLEDTVGTIHRYGHIDLEKAMIQIGMDLGIFKVLTGTDGPLTVEEVAQRTNVDPQLMRRFLRYYNTINVVTEVSAGRFEGNNITKNLTEKVLEAALHHYYELVSGQYRTMRSYLKANGYQNPTDETHTAFHEAFNTHVHPFQWMTEHPHLLDHFNTYMALRRQADLSWLTVYPVREETAGGGMTADRALYVNVGGGIGHQCAEFRETYPDIPGRVILQDLPATIERRALQTAGVENIAHDFFEPQPVKGAKFYYMRGVPHNHPPHRVKQLFANIRDAMAADSVLLVDETVLPSTGVGFIAASIDLTMLGAFASMERTESDWRELVESVGLELVRSYTYNASDNETVMDIRLPKSS
ncbi:S-adenosyl-L-methionine-dependent methyltransferase [Apodospora peruviana]|uniref:S-adenosyl-L-methionine-dependent methyltransferase n=1 Tax=Apodospora peruviana TaxID=516989 RepID=A0AAE0IS20_9PEZI|nr:S-adenosyl-L-methionine-dependent methyltransferase [Apodospora peruviana]